MKSKKLPPDVVDHWPEVFDHVEVHAVPVEYLSSIYIHFDDGRVWDIAIDQDKIAQDNPRAIEESIEQLLEEYEDVITSIDFRLNIEKVKKDISARTKTFMKKRR